MTHETSSGPVASRPGAGRSRIDALHALVLRPWGHPHVGVVHDRTPERLVELMPNYPVAGPNCVALFRCEPGRADAVIEETRALVASRRLPCHWILDDGTTPAGLDERLEAHGLVRLEDVQCMVLELEEDRPPAPPAGGPELVDGLRDPDLFVEAESILAAAFDEDPLPAETLLRRFDEAAADPDLHLAVARVDGRIAGAGWTVVRPEGVLSVGSAVHPEFRGGSVYRALMAERVRLAREAGVAGCGTPGTAGSARILGRQGYRPIGRWRRFADPDPGGAR